MDAFTEAVEGLADAETEAAGAAGEAVELGVELGELGGVVGGEWPGIGATLGVGKCEGELRMIIRVYSLDTERL